MKTYPEMATEYLKTALKKMIEGRNSLDAEEFGFNDGIENWDLEEIEDRINWVFTDSFFVTGRNKNCKENVLNNIEYVIHAIDQTGHGENDTEVLNWFLKQDWEQLNHEAKYYAIIDVSHDVAKWFYDELKKANPAKPKYKHEYVFLSIKHAFQISFYDLTETQLYQIMQNNPEFILSKINRMEVK